MNTCTFILILFGHKGEFLVWRKTAANLAPTHTYLFYQNMHGYFTCHCAKSFTLFFMWTAPVLSAWCGQQAPLCTVSCLLSSVSHFLFISSFNVYFGKASSSSPCFLGKFASIVFSTCFYGWDPVIFSKVWYISWTSMGEIFSDYYHLWTKIYFLWGHVSGHALSSLNWLLLVS